jgi:hypothetical protein
LRGTGLAQISGNEYTGENKVKKIIIGLILVYISTLWGTGAFAVDSISNSAEKSDGCGPAISSTETQEDWSDLSEQAAGGGYSCELINDGSFENGPPEASAWTEWKDPGNSSRILNPYSEWDVYSYDGTYSWWGGGYDDSLNPVSNYVEQEITIPDDATQLRFYMISHRPDTDDPTPADFFYVSINSATTPFTLELVQANDSPGCPDACEWEEKTVDISDYAGQTVTLRFEVQSDSSDDTGNVLVDYIRVCSPPFGQGLSAIFLLLLGD